MTTKKSKSEALAGVPASRRRLTAREKEFYQQKYLSQKYIDIRSDFGFMHVMRNKEILKMLLGDILGEEVTYVDRLPNEIDRFLGHEKDVTMDVLCTISGGREVIIEFQRQERKAFRNRMFYYGASMIHAQLASGDYYDKMRPVIVICFEDFEDREHESESDKVMCKYVMMERETHETYGEQMTICICELPKLKKKSLEEMNNVEIWLYLMKNMTTFVDTPQDLPSRYQPVMAAAEMKGLREKQKMKYLRAMLSEAERRDIELAAYDRGARHAFAKGEAKGRAEGREEGSNVRSEEIARKMQEMGLSSEQIKQATGIEL